MAGFWEGIFAALTRHIAGVIVALLPLTPLLFVKKIAITGISDGCGAIRNTWLLVDLREIALSWQQTGFYRPRPKHGYAQ